MSMKTRRDRDREKMRRRILDAAKQLFVKEGFENVSMRRIAMAIEYSPAAIYRYFKNKREILSVLRDEGFEMYLARQRRGAEMYPDPYEGLLQGGKNYIRFAVEEPDSFHLLFGTDCTQVEMEGEHAAGSVESLNHFRRVVGKLIETGCMGDVDLDTAVYCLWSTVHGLAQLIRSGQVEALSGEKLDRVLRFNLRPAFEGQTTSRK